MTDVPLATIDIGNSRVKVGLFDQQPSRGELVEPAQTTRWQHHSEPRWPAVVPGRVLVGSVAPDQSGPLLDRLPRDWPTPKLLTASDFDLTLNVDEPNRVGIDRVANAAAASVLYPNDATLIVDAGSAITVDLVEPGGVFCGGAIFPGLQMAADTLTERTSLLPGIRFDDEDDVVWPGRNTLDAIRVGVRDAAKGSVYYFVSKFRSRYEPKCHQLLCGGDAEHFVMGLAEREVYESLTLSGLALAGVER